jgi:serine/threonine-protein kinase
MLDERLGAGRGGQVWAARDDRTGGRVAVKLRHEAGSDADIELAGLRTLEHPNLLRVLDAGTDGGSVFVVTELATQGSLEAIAKPLAPDDLKALAAQMLDALAYLHAHGILHADIKTENVFVASIHPPMFKLGDFGLAHRLAVASGLRGSPAFMPPEVIRGEPADERSDLYALGITLYEAAFGSLPFEDTDTRRVLARQLTETPARLADPGSVSPRLVGLLRRLLPKEPAERPADARAALAEWRGEEAALPTWVPPRLGVLLGRDSELHTLEQVLSSSGAIALDGPPGIGKTRLLREFALRAQLSGTKVEWWSPSVARATEAPEEAGPSTSNVPTLLIVDEFETLPMSAHDAVATRAREALLDSTSPSLVCVAGRGAAAKFLSDALAAGGLAEPTALQLRPWSDVDIRTASAALLGARSVHDDLVRLVASVSGGVPAGVQAACRALVEQRLLVRGANDVLSVPATASAQDLAQSLAHQVQDSIAALSANELRLLRVLALLRAPTSLEWLLALHPTSATDLVALQRLGFVALAPASRSPEFVIAHTSARDAALLDLDAHERRLLHDRLADAFDLVNDQAATDVHRAQGTDLERARAAVDRFASTDQALYAADLMVKMYEGLLDLWPQDYHAEEKHRTHLRFVDALHRIGDYRLTIEAAERMRGQTSNVEQAQEFCNRIARVYVARGEGDAALAVLGTPPPGRTGLEAALIRAGALGKQGRYLESLELCEQQSPLITIDDPLHDELIDLQSSALTWSGRLHDAEVLLEATANVCEEHGNLRRLPHILWRLGRSRFYQGKFAEAEPVLRRAYDLFEQHGERAQQVRVLNALAAVCAETGRLSEARNLLRVALDLTRRLGDSFQTLTVLGNLVELQGVLGLFAEALEHAKSAIDVGEAKGLYQTVVPTLINRASILITIGAIEPSMTDVARVESAQLEPLYRAQVAMVLAEAALLRGDLDGAATQSKASDAFVQDIGARDETVRLGMLEARLLFDRGDLVAALEHAQVTSARAKEMGLTASALQADVLLAEMGLEAESESAAILARVTLETARTLGLRECIWRAQRVIARASGLRGDLVACVAGYDACLELLREQCAGLPDDLADAYISHRDRAKVLDELTAVRERITAG